MTRSYDERTRLLLPTPGRGNSPASSPLPSGYTSIGDLSPIIGVPQASSTRQNLFMARKMSRIRTNSVSILNEDGDDVISTSFGPVVMPDAPERNRDWVLGWFLAIISGVLFTANNFFVKYLDMDALEMLLIRSLLQTVVVLVGLLSAKSHLLPTSTKDRVLVISQGLLSGVRVFLQFACLSFMPLGDALTLVFTEPLWTIILSKIVLKIHIGWWKMVFGMFLISGMVLTIQPPFIFPQPSQDVNQVSFNTTTDDPLTSVTLEDYVYSVNFPTSSSVIPDLNEQTESNNGNKLSQLVKITGIDKIKLHRSDTPGDDVYAEGTYYIGAILALGTAIVGSTANVIIAKCERVSSSVMVFYSGLGGVILAFAFSIMDPDNRIIFNITAVPYDEWLILLMLGGSGLLGYYSMTRSLQLIPPTTVAVLRALEIILAYVAQAAVMGEIPNVLAITGSSIVMLCVIGFALEETFYSCIDCY